MVAPPHDPLLLLVTGVMAAGKSSVAQRLAERLPRSVHLRGDLFRRMIVSGRAEPEPPLSAEALGQLRLRYRAAAAAARPYLEGGFAVVWQDVILGAVLGEVVDELLRAPPAAPLHLVVLCPDPAVVAEREAGRAKRGYRGFTPHDLDGALRRDTPRLGLWLDSSALSLDATVDAVLARLPEARLTGA